MENIDKRKLEASIKYIDALANGLNPSTNQPIPKESFLNNSNIIRCMFFVKEILEEVNRNNGIKKSKKQEEKEPFQYEVLINYQYQEDTTITRILKQINSLSKENVKKITIKPITKFLKDNGFLKEIQEQNKTITYVTDKGKEIGLYNEYRTSSISNVGTYLAVIYNRKAQEFIVDNLEIILNNK